MSRKLVIPSYQRPYAWKLENIEEIFQTIRNTKEDNEDICFFGSIILSRKNGNNGGFGQESYYIIDGQQRLSSFLLISRVILNKLEAIRIDDSKNTDREYIRLETKIDEEKRKVSQIIKTVSLSRGNGNQKNSDPILKFIKTGEESGLNQDLEEKIKTIKEKLDLTEMNKSFNREVIKNLLDSLDFILNKIKFCLICITGTNAENFAINLFNTLNTTGEPLTAFEVLKSELYTIDTSLSNRINMIQTEIIKKYAQQRGKIVSHTGKLLLYLPLYRGDFEELQLSDKKFQDQRRYVQRVLTSESAISIVTHIEKIDKFYSKYWLNGLNSELKLKEDEKVCFQFLKELRHDRVLPILIRNYDYDPTSLGECLKICTAFSSLWRAFYDGGTSGIDNAYKDISSEFKSEFNLNEVANEAIDLHHLREISQKLLLKKLQSASGNNGNDMEELKQRWVQKIKTSSIYKNKKLTKFLLFIAYNKLYFNPANKQLTKGNGLDILKNHSWTKDDDYKTIEHIVPQSNQNLMSHVHTLGNLTLLPSELNTSLGNKPFSDKLEKFKEFCSTQNQDKYPYLPLIKHIASYDEFGQKEIEERSEVLGKFIWETLAEDWLKLTPQ